MAETMTRLALLKIIPAIIWFQFVWFGSAFAKALAFPPIVRFDFVAQVCQRAFDRLDEIGAIHRHSTHAGHRLALGKVIRYSKDLSKFRETICRPLDQIVRRLPGARIEHLDFIGRNRFCRLAPGAAAVEKDGDRRSRRVPILSQPGDQLIPRRGGVSRRTARQLRPIVQQAVAIDEDADQRHLAGKHKPAKLRMEPESEDNFRANALIRENFQQHGMKNAPIDK
jgi:hypothetical protein